MTDADPTWYLMRTLVISIGKPPAEIHWHADWGPVHVTTVTPLTKNGEPLGILAIAYLPLDAPPIRDDAFEMPEDARALAEDALEMLARMVTLKHGETFSLSSPSPCLGFHCTDPSALEVLEGTVVGQYDAGTTMGVSMTEIMDNPDLMAVVRSRLDGVVLLTEALNALSPVGQFTLFWRLLERAFHRGHRQTGPLLFDFLATGPHGFERAEVDEWVDRRNDAVHADRHQSPVLDRHVQPFIGRMREAAFDVLLNKETWLSANSDRRVDHPWRPAVGSAGRGGDIFGTPGKEWRMQVRLLDPFKSFPRLLAGHKEHPLVPPGLWVRHEGSDLVLRRLGEGTLELP